MSRNTLIGIEWGRKSIAYERLWDLAEALGVSITDVIESKCGTAMKRPAAEGKRSDCSE